MTLPDTPSSDVHPVGAAHALQLHDARPFFDKVLAHGVQHGPLAGVELQTGCAHNFKLMTTASSRRPMCTG